MRLPLAADAVARCVLGTALVLEFCCVVGAQDTVYLSSETSSEGHLSVEGKVVDYTSAGVTIDMGGKARTYAARLVERIETVRTESQLQGDSLYAAGDFPAALAAYRKARDQDPRSWVRREITARIVWCYRSLGQATSAVEEFLLLVRTDPGTPYFDSIPLAWHGSFQSRAVMPSAITWLREETMPASVLIGASYLLQTEHGSLALAKLQDLGRSSDATVASLAGAQAWRVTLTSADRSQVEAWEKTVEAMPAPLRAGPYYVVGQGWARNEQWEKAALVLVRIAVLYPEHRELASRSLLDAAMALGKLGRQDEASRLYAELVRDYPESPLVTEAQSRLAPPSAP
ncbi:MAG: tetratricopeptide repeat protein [Thermoguttaceae bacterium]